MKKEDRNTALIVGIIMIVSTISLVAVLYFLWQLVGPPITAFINQIQYGVSVNRSDYNFPYPGQPGATTTTTAQGLVKVKGPKPNNFLDNLISRDRAQQFLKHPNYNFAYADYPDMQSSPQVRLAGQTDEMLNSNQINALAGKSVVYESNLSISIPRQEISSPLYAGYDYHDLLAKGFWIYPGSRPIGEGTVILLCYRRFLLPLDSRSCWYADQIKAGDPVIIYKGQDIRQKYTVTQTQVLPGSRNEIYEINDANVLKIITAHPLGTNSSRLIITAVPD